MAKSLKAVVFNPKTEVHLLEYANNLANFSGWVKQKIEENLYPEQVFTATQLRALKELMQQYNFQPVASPQLKSDVEEFF